MERHALYLLSRGILVFCAEGAKLLETLNDPLLVEYFLQLRSKGHNTVDVDILGERQKIVLDSRLATWIFEESLCLFGPGRQEKLLFNSFIPENVTVLRGDAWQQTRCLNEAVLGYEPSASTGQHDKVCPLQQSRAIPFVIGLVEDFFTKRRAPTIWAEFEEGSQLASKIIFGSTEPATTLLAVLRYVQRPQTLLGQAALPPSLKQQYQEVLLQPVREESLAYYAQQYELLPTEVLVEQYPIWFLQLNNTFTVLLVSMLTLVCSSRKVYARALLNEEAYLNGIILETLRLLGPIFGLQRQVDTDVVVAGEYWPQDTQVFLPLSMYMRDPLCYHKPNCFSPERWTDATQDTDLWERCQFVFSTGVQTCPARLLVMETMRKLLEVLLPRGYELLGPPLDLENVPQVLNVAYVFFRTSR